MVTAVAAHGEDVLSDLPCKCDNHCGQMLLSCGCAEASGQLVELVAARTGEGVPLARATSDAEGGFVLTGLDEETLTLFADAPDAVGWLPNVASDAQDARVVLAQGRTIHGRVVSSDGKPAKGALVTAIFAAHSRFFDAVADEKGEFRLGPLPLGEYAVVAMLGGLLPDHKQVDEDEHEALELELSVPRALSGVVVADGAPVAGVTVALEGMHRKRTVITDAKGEFRIERLRPGKYELNAESPKGPGSASTLLSKHEDLTGLTITLEPGQPLEGRVVTERGQPLHEARVSLLVDKKWRHTDSDEKGAFRFEGVTAEEHHLYARQDGFLDVRVMARGGQSGIELRMPPAALLSGLVRTTTGNLVLEYSVRARAVDGGDEDQHDVSQRTSDGGFALEVWPGDYDLRVDAPPLAGVTVRVSAPSTSVVVTMKPGAKIAGTVLDFEGQPAPGVTVAASTATDEEEVTTGAAGRFEFAGLEAGEWAVTAAVHDGPWLVWSASGAATLAEGATAELVLRPREGARFAGVVLSSEGEPVSGARVHALQEEWDGGAESEGASTATSDSLGRFRLHSLRAGPVWLTVEVDEARINGMFSESAPDEKVVLKLDPGSKISGRVVTSDGRPVRAFKVDDMEVDSEDGRFSLPVPSYSTSVTFQVSGYARLLRRVELKDGDNPLGDVVMQRGRPVSGVVRDARSGEPIQGALIDIARDQADFDFSLYQDKGAVRSDAQGRYRLPAVDASATHLLVSAPRHVSSFKALVGDSVDFELQPGSQLKVSVIDARGAPAQVGFLRALGPEGRTWRDYRGSPPGTFEASDLAPGVWWVSVDSDHAYRGASVTLGETPTQLVLSEVTNGVTISVNVVGGAEKVLLLPGTLPRAERVFSFLTWGGTVSVINGVAHDVTPGTWTVMAIRGTSHEAAVQPIEVKASGNPVWTITPQWQQLSEADFTR
ncbi:MAG: carboxypeptidase-like regulatory domain-containing protein [Archangium sp.]|nr:carboxypeptidase-like regulatory domain-containing protein [Archangium sp.]